MFEYLSFSLVRCSIFDDMNDDKNRYSDEDETMWYLSHPG